MNAKYMIAIAAMSVIPAVCNAQSASYSFDKAAGVTCEQAAAMAPSERMSLAVFLAEHAAKNRGVTLPTDERGAQLAYFVRGGCTMAPNATLFTVIDRAVLAELVKR